MKWESVNYWSPYILILGGVHVTPYLSQAFSKFGDLSSVFQNTMIGSSIYTVLAKDEDTGSAGQVSYIIEEVSVTTWELPKDVAVLQKQPSHV